MDLGRAGRVCAFVAGLLTSSMGLYHFWLPYAFGWPQYVSAAPPMIGWALLALNFFFSFLLLWGGVTSLVIARSGRAGAAGRWLLAGMMAFWILNAGYQLVVPMPMPPRMAVLRWCLFSFSAVTVTLYAVALLQRPRAQ